MGTGDGNPPVGPRGEAPVGVWGRIPQNLKQFADIVYIFWHFCTIHLLILEAQIPLVSICCATNLSYNEYTHEYTIVVQQSTANLQQIKQVEFELEADR